MSTQFAIQHVDVHVSGYMTEPVALVRFRHQPEPRNLILELRPRDAKRMKTSELLSACWTEYVRIFREDPEP